MSWHVVQVLFIFFKLWIGFNLFFFSIADLCLFYYFLLEYIHVWYFLIKFLKNISIKSVYTPKLTHFFFLPLCARMANVILYRNFYLRQKWSTKCSVTFSIDLQSLQRFINEQLNLHFKVHVYDFVIFSRFQNVVQLNIFSFQKVSSWQNFLPFAVSRLELFFFFWTKSNSFFACSFISKNISKNMSIILFLLSIFHTSMNLYNFKPFVAHWLCFQPLLSHWSKFFLRN